jgi:hypothetical protein
MSLYKLVVSQVNPALNREDMAEGHQFWEARIIELFWKPVSTWLDILETLV